MANILLRSPYYVYLTESGGSCATLELSINGTLRYTLTKDTDDTDSVLFDISELARDYLDITYDGTYTSQTVAITGTVTFLSGCENPITPAQTFSHTGFDGYGKYLDGSNPTIASGSLMQSNTQIYIPENTAGKIPEEDSNAIDYVTFGTSATSVSAGGQTITINRICEPKYTPIKVTFVNKFGALQDLYFFKKRTDSISTTKEQYKRSVLADDGTYDIDVHQKRILNVQGRYNVSMNTGFIGEEMNEVFEQLLLSEQVWAYIDNTVTPIDITTSQLTYKTSLNDRLINYTIGVEYAFGVINDLR